MVVNNRSRQLVGITDRTKKALGKYLNANKLSHLKFITPYMYNNGTKCLEN